MSPVCDDLGVFANVTGVEARPSPALVMAMMRRVVRMGRVRAPVACRSHYTNTKDDWVETTRGHSRPGVLNKTAKTGMAVLNDPLLNKGLAFPMHERDRLGIRGLLPPTVDENLEKQKNRLMKRIRALPNNLLRFATLNSLQDRNEVLFYRILCTAALRRDSEAGLTVLLRRQPERACSCDLWVHDAAFWCVRPRLILSTDTPTVGLGALNYGELFRRPRGLFFSANDRGAMISMAYNWPREDVQIAVITDGSRILGLGDLGVNGMAIPIGKLSLYCAIAGIHPSRTLPVFLDVGTDNKELLTRAGYLGIKQKRLRGDEYFAVLDECIQALKNRWPHILLQFEDFNNENAIPVLQRYRDEILCFNDDIQGTGAVCVAGVIGALRSIGHNSPSALCDQRIVIAGAGTAGIGIAESLAFAMESFGLSYDKALRNLTLVDQYGALGAGRQQYASAQGPFLHDGPIADGASLLDTVRTLKPHILIGVTGISGLFSEDVVREMSKHHERPIIFPLSNPTANTECTAPDALAWTNGTAIYASGSPFDPVAMPDGRVVEVNQANNMYTFPGLGLGALIANAKLVTRGMLLAASLELAEQVPQERLDRGLIFPDLDTIRGVTQSIAVKVVRAAQDDQVARTPLPEDDDVIRAVVEHESWDPHYAAIVPQT
ncbi:hypothetical protein PBRA_007234 [Plasmodiophora brassicae]|uniref:Malic enzyme n=1 Tax=Plasmodiophora brassicae TaxID=37360 RepID=A0A0G4IWN3_PLABS|nr:hypothetical protein PBRA_007234 [Plasmodiophora brassicae]